MAEDATTPPFLPDAPNPGSQTKTETTISTVETDNGTLVGRRAGELFGMSGRFWIALIAVLGAAIIAISALFRQNLDPQMLGMILGGFIALAGNISSTYLGQNAGPTKPKPS